MRMYFHIEIIPTKKKTEILAFFLNGIAEE